MLERKSRVRVKEQRVLALATALALSSVARRTDTSSIVDLSVLDCVSVVVNTLRLPAEVSDCSIC